MHAAYYSSMRSLAVEKRRELAIDTSSICLSRLRTIFKAEGITIDLRKLPPRIRGVYMCDDDDPSVLINKSLPEEPRIFTMVHELKHHYCDRGALNTGELKCGDYNQNEMIEIGAEVFAAEFIFPASEFITATHSVGMEAGNCTAEMLVHLKRTCKAKVSYTFLQKGLERLNLIDKGQFKGVKFTVLEERIYGTPIYKQDWFRDRRGRKK
jgi:Zn-dependent peptidase ImmA (M78 family)